jgi:hypothetical protein
MKTITLFLVSMIMVLTALGQKDKKDKDSVAVNKNAPYILFEKLEHDYGTIPYNGDGSYEFEFKNTGKMPLVLQNCQSSCGCTIPDWPKDPIKKGGTGKIIVKYATSRVGPFFKTVTVYSNASNSPITLTIKGTVSKPEEQKTLPEKENVLPATNNENH